VGPLHAHPDAGTVAEQLAEPDGDRRRHRLALLEDVVKVLAGNAEQRGDLGLAPAGRRDHLAQQCGQRVDQSCKDRLGSKLTSAKQSPLRANLPVHPRPAAACAERPSGMVACMHAASGILLPYSARRYLNAASAVPQRADMRGIALFVGVRMGTRRCISICRK
jgi:hypothetical protein